MPKIPKLSFYQIFCAIWFIVTLAESKIKYVKPLRQSHETVVSFLHHQEDRPKFYWVVLEAEFQSDNFTTAMESLIGSIASVRGFVDGFSEPRAQKQHDRPKLILQKPLENLNEISSAMKSYDLKLPELSINFCQKTILSQNIFVRIKDDRRELARFVDSFEQTVLSVNKDLKMVSIQKDSIERFQQDNKMTDPKINPLRQSLVESEEFAQNVNSKAQSYCKSLQMKLDRILSSKQLTFKQIQNEIYQNSTQTETEDPTQMSYVDAFNQRYQNQNLEFISRLFQVRAKCTGNRPLQQKKIRKKGDKRLNLESDQVLNGTELQNKVNKHKKRKTVIT